MDRQYQADIAVAEARSYLGVKWRHRGRSRFSIDCIGLVVAAVRAGGVVMRDRLDYGRLPWKDGLEREMREHFGEPVSFENAQTGDVALMCWDADKAVPAHVGMLGDGDNGLRIIHSYSCHAVAEHDIDDQWRRRILAVFRP